MHSNIFVVKRRSLPDVILFWGLLTMLAVGWILQILLPGLTTNIFELLFFILSLSVFLRKSSHTSEIYLYLFIIILYVLLSYIYAVIIRGANLFDFIMAYKFIWYIALLLPFTNTKLLDSQSLYTLLKSFLLMFFFVYVAKFFSGDDRPTFFIENNFEILFLCFLFFANHIVKKSSKMLDMIFLLAITAISGSRSGVLLALITVVFSTDIKQIVRTKNIFLPLATILGAIGAYTVFINRTSNGVESTDRYRFYHFFLDSISDWDWWQFFTGSTRITKLPDHVCASLAFYEKLLSFEGDGSCYSVIFHSFNMRILFDHGIIVIVFLIFLLNKILHRISIKEKICIFILLFINGLSVSSINSVYAALGIAIIASTTVRKN